MGLDLTFIGTGNAFAPTRYWSSFIVNERYLFDAPPTLLPHLKKLGIDPGGIDVIFISHFHGDHYFGLPFLLLEYAELAPRTRDLTIVGPPGIAKRVQAATDLAFNNVFRKDRGYQLTFVEAKDGRSGEAGGVPFTSKKVTHVPNLESFGFRARIDGHTIGYTGDSAMCEALVDIGNEADVFVAECSCWHEGCAPIHLTPRNILALRERITPATQFILTHIGAGEAPKSIADAGIRIADDLKTISF